MSAAATRAQLQDLLRLLTEHLTRNLRSPKATAEMLGVARKLLAHCGIRGAGERDRRRLESLYVNYCKQLSHAIETRPTAALLAEARQFLFAQGIQKDAPVAATVAGLADVSLPFNTKPH